MNMHSDIVKAKAKDPVDAAVGRQIRLRRRQLRMSQEKLGEALGVSFQQVQKYERGTNRVGAGRLAKLAEVLSVPLAYFFPQQDVEAPMPAGADVAAIARDMRATLATMDAQLATLERIVS